MRLSDEFRDATLVQEIAARLRSLPPLDATIMEVCGTHTMSVARFGLKSLLPEGVRLISGPGCPVCVTDQRDIDAFLSIGSQPAAALASFGDMLRVPGSTTSLERLRAAGADVRVVYSPMDALDIARANPTKEVVFFGVGFETTMPAVALAIRSAYDEGLGNFSVFCVHKTIPKALRALLSAPDVRISGLLLPGHVTAIIGAGAYELIPREFRTPCAVAGFEPVDILLGVESILTQLARGEARVDNVYRRAAPNGANEQAAALIQDVFTPCDTFWRGLGVIPGSGVAISHRYAQFDARVRFADACNVPSPPESPCRCGDVLRGVTSPPECPLFSSPCTPTDPIGPCMVSGEGACAAAYKYGATR